MAKIIEFPERKNYQVKVSLKDVKPPIWRRFIVDPLILLPDLHKILQSVMGWSNSHLHQFIKGKVYYALPDEDSFGESKDYRKITLQKLLSKEQDTLLYEYDFGDGWLHVIELEKILPDSKLSSPVCLEGKRSCPPEDCGGSFGYSHLLEVLSNKNDPEYEDILDWIGPDFDPEYFNLPEINDLLSSEDYGCISLDPEDFE